MDAGEHRAVLQTETLHTNLTVPSRECHDFYIFVILVFCFIILLL
jgi:hypothetical protein